MPSVTWKVQAAVFDALKAAAGSQGHPLHGVPILFGPPVDRAVDEYVAVGAGLEDEPFGDESSREFRSFPATNPTAVEERFLLRLAVDHLGAAGRDQRREYERANELADAVETVLGADITFNGLVQHTLTVRRRSIAYRTDRRRGCRVHMDFSGVARRGVT